MYPFMVEIVSKKVSSRIALSSSKTCTELTTTKVFAGRFV
jgi:hypothetical protein